MEKDLILTAEDLHKLNVILTNVIDAGRIDCSLIINKSGRLITSQSESSDYDTISLAALISGNFASSSSIANKLGEEEFTSMLQEGKDKHIYVSLIDSNTILAAVFDKRSTVENVRDSIDEQKSRLLEQLNVIYSNIQLSPELNIDLSQGTLK
jgi:predicted regulator of Ras-like GTPase activity (Roadblock/LC7/MglB family)